MGSNPIGLISVSKDPEYEALHAYARQFMRPNFMDTFNLGEYTELALLGAKAASEGKPQSDNPFRARQLKHFSVAWDYGWRSMGKQR